MTNTNVAETTKHEKVKAAFVGADDKLRALTQAALDGLADEQAAALADQPPIPQFILSALNDLLDPTDGLADATRLVTAWPLPHDSDASSVTVFNTPGDLLRGRRTTTTWPRALAKIASGKPSHIIRDAAARITSAQLAEMAPDKFRVTTNMGEMLDYLQRGPTSCMSHAASTYNSSVHPYTCYDPKYGWGMAVRLDGDLVVARALVLHDDDGEPLCWVRSFGKSSEGYTHNDTLLEGWMTLQGYKPMRGWPDGTKLLRIDDGRCDESENEAPYVAPYVDGSNDSAAVWADCLVIGGSGGEEVALDYASGFAHDKNDKNDDDDDDYYDDDDDDY